MKTCSWSSLYWPMFSGRSQNTGFLMYSRRGTIVHSAGLGGAPAGPSNSSPRTPGGVAASGGGAPNGAASGGGGNAASGGIGPAGGEPGGGGGPGSGGSGLAAALGVGTATTAMPRPAIIIALRRSILAMDEYFKAISR